MSDITQYGSALGLVERTTKDVDIVALRSGEDLEGAEPLPEGLRAAGDLVARDFSLPAEWLNPGPTGLLEFGIDQGPGKHEQDLRALAPSEDELLAAARWSRTQDPSEGYASVLRRALASFGVEDGAL